MHLLAILCAVGQLNTLKSLLESADIGIRDDKFKCLHSLFRSYITVFEKYFLHYSLM